MKASMKYLVFSLVPLSVVSYYVLYAFVSNKVMMESRSGSIRDWRMLREETFSNLFHNPISALNSSTIMTMFSNLMNKSLILPQMESIKNASKDHIVLTTRCWPETNSSEMLTRSPTKPSQIVAYKNGTVEWLVTHRFVSQESRYDFKLLINSPTTCWIADGGEKSVFLLVLVISRLKNFAMRRLVRETWGNHTEYEGKGIATVFLLARSPIHDSDQDALEAESKQYHDIIQGDFIDTYKNLSLKTIMGMRWAGSFCAHANYVMKTDDDMFVGYESIVKHLSDPSIPTDHFMTGYTIASSPIRDIRSKWYMPQSIYPYDRYPLFCSGSGYIVSSDLPQRIYEKARATPFIYLEDVLVAICVCKLGIVPVGHKEFNNYKVIYNYCKYKKIFTTHLVSVSIEEKYNQWRDLTSGNRHCP